MDVQEARDSAMAGQNADLRRRLWRKVNFKLIGQGLAPVEDHDAEFTGIAQNFLEGFHEKARLLSEHRCPADQRIEAFLQRHFADLNLPWRPQLPSNSLVLDEPGLARELSLPPESDEFASPLLSSYRVKNGVLHNPRSDRRTTQGTFHVAEGGLPIAGDKKAVPKAVFAELFRCAVNPPADLLGLPFASQLAGSRPDVCLAAAAADRLPAQFWASARARRWKFDSSCPARWSAISISSR